MGQQAAAAPSPPSTRPGKRQDEWPRREKLSRFHLATTQVVPPPPPGRRQPLSPSVRECPTQMQLRGAGLGRTLSPAQSGQCGTPGDTRTAPQAVPASSRNRGAKTPALTSPYRRQQRLRPSRPGSDARRQRRLGRAPT